MAQRATDRTARAADASLAAAETAARESERARRTSERTSRDVRRMARQVATLNGVIHQQADATTEALLRAGWQLPEEAVEQRHLRQALDAIAGTADVIAGPWTGEVGFELLYWIPFLNWLQGQGLDGARLIVVSRGGTAEWYRHLTSRYIELLDVMTPEQLRMRTADPAEKRKQYDPKRSLDREILSAVQTRYGTQDAAQIHPGAMFRLFGALWRKRATVDLVESFTNFRRLGDPQAPPASLSLPPRYVAAKFYYSDAFPATDQNRQFIADLLRDIGAQVPVVLLGTGVQIDDHRDAEFTATPNVRVVDATDNPQRNLEKQTAIIRGARGFVGTYGGFSYLAPFYGVRSVSFFSRRAFESHHLDLANRVFDKILPGGFVALDRRAISSVEPVVSRWT